MTHASVPAHQRAELGITDSLIRLSVGCESTIDLLKDLEHALAVSVSSRIFFSFKCTDSMKGSRTRWRAQC